MKIVQFLQDDSGNFSSTRLAFLVWVFFVLIIWGVSSIHLVVDNQYDKSLPEIPTSVQVVLATLMGGKVVQKYGEKDANES